MMSSLINCLLLKFSCTVISNRLVIERDSKLTFGSYLEE